MVAVVLASASICCGLTRTRGTHGARDTPAGHVCTSKDRLQQRPASIFFVSSIEVNCALHSTLGPRFAQGLPRCVSASARSAASISGRRSDWAARAQAGSGDSEAGPLSMSLEEAYQLLGVQPGASFDEILAAKNKKRASLEGDQEMERQVDLAYDVLFMQDLKKRIGGQVSGSVRFADVPKPKRKPASQGPMQSLPGGVRVDKPANNTLVAQSAVFGALAAWSLFQGVSEPASVAASDVAGLQLALATGAAVYFLRENKRLKLGRAAGLASAGLVLGVLLGSGLQAWLRVDVVPLAGLSSPGVFVSGFAILGLWASCTFLI